MTSLQERETKSHRGRECVEAYVHLDRCMGRKSTFSGVGEMFALGI